ncbi:hypothetical protein JX265_011631 [Neoarthrinium moseri]|uniref:Uncharacterized protein n=1 Tax=Neoarthrinium moseri TaxID=1658444 RepID=A0A9P9WBW8_9PEZI|nr:hypothetical protein JX265_011631 [Neoarthrinium moseri]
MEDVTAAPVAIVTGSASGIGLAAAKFLVGRGYRVMMADWDYDRVVTESAGIGPSTAAIKCDVSSWESQLAAFEKTIELWGRVDVVAANAGIPEQVPLLFETGSTPTKPNTIVVDVDLTGALYSVSLAIYFFRRNEGRGGKIIITSSQVGIHPFPTGPIYGAAKAGTIHLVRSMAPKLAQEKIYLNTFAPGLTISAITAVGESVYPKHIITPMENHMKAIGEFIDKDIFGYVYEVDAGGLHHRKDPEYLSPEHQTWLGAPETQEMWKKAGTLGSANLSG